MSDLRKSAENAKELLETWHLGHSVGEVNEVIDKLEKALEQPQQKPYAWEVTGEMVVSFITCDEDYVIRGVERGEFKAMPLYTQPSNIRRPSFKVMRKILNPYMMEHETPATWLFDLLDDHADACNIPKEGE